MTAQELKIFTMLSDMWNDFRKLPEEHPNDAHEVLFHIHAIQDKILARAAFREYLKTNP